MTVNLALASIKADLATQTRTLGERFGQVRNVKDFGATGDGSTDDTDAIQAAIDWNCLVATAITPTSSNVLHFASVPDGLFDTMGSFIPTYDETTPTALPNRSVAGWTSTTVTVDVNVAVQVEIGDRIFFGRNKGVIFFPPGAYRVTSAINLITGGDQTSFIVQGSGKASSISGSIASGYVLDCNVSSVNFALRRICDIAVTNTHTTTGGGIRMGGAMCSEVTGCDVQGFIGINILGAGGSSQTNSIRNCSLASSAVSLAVNSCGIAARGDKTLIDSCDFNSGWRRGIAACGTSVNILNCRFEVNTVGIACGVDETGTNHGLLGFTIIGCGWESNSIGIEFEGGSGQGAIIGGQLQGFNGAAPGGLNPQYGIKINSDCLHTAVIQGFNCAANFDVASVAILGAVANPKNITFISCGAANVTGPTAWSTPTAAHHAQFINCYDISSGTAVYFNPEYTFANLPANPATGDTYNISNSNTVVWGANAAGGGANHVSVRWNGANWTVVGK